MAQIDAEVVWPLDRDDYLIVCDQHPIPYTSCAELLARDGEDDDEAFNPPTYLTCSAKERSDYRIVATNAALINWVSLSDLASMMECSKREIASLAHHLKSAVDRGLLRREQRPRTVNGIKRLFWVYRRVDE